MTRAYPVLLSLDHGRVQAARGSATNGACNSVINMLRPTYTGTRARARACTCPWARSARMGETTSSRLAHVTLRLPPARSPT